MSDATAQSSISSQSSSLPASPLHDSGKPVLKVNAAYDTLLESQSQPPPTV